MKKDEERLLKEIAEDFPRHIYLLGKDLGEEDFVDVLFKQNMGKVILKLKGITQKHPELNELWTRFFSNTTQALTDWYSTKRNDIKEPGSAARMVITELSVHNEEYISNKEAFRDLILDQKTVDI